MHVLTAAHKLSHSENQIQSTEISSVYRLLSSSPPFLLLLLLWSKQHMLAVFCCCGKNGFGFPEIRNRTTLGEYFDTETLGTDGQPQSRQNRADFL